MRARKSLGDHVLLRIPTRGSSDTFFKLPQCSNDEMQKTALPGNGS